MQYCKYLVLGMLGGSLFNVMQPMDQAQQPTTRNDIFRIIREAESLAQSKPGSALSWFQQAYYGAESRSWDYGLKDGKLALVLLKGADSEQKDVCDIQLLKLLLDKVDLIRRDTDGPIEEHATLLCAKVAHRLMLAYCGSLALSQDLDMVWKAESLAKATRELSDAEKLEKAHEKAFAGDERTREMGESQVRELEELKQAEIKFMLEQREIRLNRLKEKEAAQEADE
ncbi:MAG: hypothetical protein AB7F19_04090 [Candidatus Babeliales bacterium]